MKAQPNPVRLPFRPTPWPVAKVHQRAFTLLEVMVATAVLFACVFAILSVVATGLKGARVLQEPEVDITALAGLLSLTNQLEEGEASGNFEEIAPGLYRDWHWTRNVREFASNGLYQVDFTAYKRGGQAEQKLTILLYRQGNSIGPGLRPVPR